MARIPWLGLAALVSMFVIPYIPSWLFEGPGTVKHWPRRHVCGVCGEAWTQRHTCRPAGPMAGPLRGELLAEGEKREPPVDFSRYDANKAGYVQALREWDLAHPEE